MKFLISLSLILMVVAMVPMAYTLWRLRSIQKILDILDKQNPPEPWDAKSQA